MKQYEIQRFSEAALREGSVWADLPVAMVDTYIWGGEYRPRAEARLACSETGLFLRMEAWEPEAFLRMEEEEHVHKDSCMELFFQTLPEEDERYVNVEINPQGILHAKIGTSREDRQLFPKTGIVVTPFLEKGETAHWGFVVEIPFSALEAVYGKRPARRMRGNFYKCGDMTPQPHYGVWSGYDWPRPDFHRPEGFGEFVYA